ncbi:hypothetical protein GK091_25570 [Spirosoma agri]|uniref:Ig-like domain-containing protein n=1 Tax=Spirosoma agri TaxID=1987381 RepID=A0A6M0IQQ0_9BACT|nr:putative Ig domain-containing protein [Spirosoma agri]NEU70272.1 hypothetical protein [Spirosoma agri]
MHLFLHRFSLRATSHLGRWIVYFLGLTRQPGPLWAWLLVTMVWVGLGLPSAQAQNATIRYVSPQGAGSQTGANWANALPGTSLQAAINASRSGDQVWVAGGMYKPGRPANTDRAVSFAMKEGVAIYGGFVGTETSLDQRPTSNTVSGSGGATQPVSSTLSGDIGRMGDRTDNSFHVIYNPVSLSLTSTAILDGFVITGGNADGLGNAESLYGGGIYNKGSGLDQVCSPHIRNCAFVANSANFGGAIYNDGHNSGISSPRLINCAFVTNTAGEVYGGAIYNDGRRGTSNPTLVNCSFVANTADRGGALFNDGRDGGTNKPALINCVLFGNGGANTIFSTDGASVTARYSLFDNTVTGYNDGGNNRTTTTSPFTSLTSVALNACGPAIDAGSNQAYTEAGGPPTDLVGNPRIYPTGGRIDMGAVEFRGSQLYVSASQTATAGDGRSWATAFADLQSALSSSSTCGTEIWVARGLYKPTAGRDTTKSFTMQQGVAIYGGFVGTETSLDQRPTIAPVAGTPSSSTLSGDIGRVGDKTDNSFHVIYNPASLSLTSTAILDGFVITGGNARRNGSSDNSGGGIYNNGSGSVCSPQIRHCTFVTNSAVGIGGAMVNDGRAGGNSSPSLTNCAFVADTSAYDGGAIYNTGQNGVSSPTLINCGFVANAAANSGGAMVNEGTNGTSNPRLVNCTFLANRAVNSGAAMYNTGYQGTSTPHLTNCVLFDNDGTNTLFSSNSATVSASYSLFDNTVTGYSDGGNNRTTITSPFTNLTSIVLNACGAAIDAGSNQAYTDAGGPPTDLLGNPRIYPTGGRIDMGAVEAQETSQPITFSQQPPSASAVCVGGRVEIPVRVTGGLPAYQWYKDGQPVSGQTSATLSLANVQTTDAGRYSVEVTASCNSLTSTAFSLTVNAPPPATLSASPSSTLSCAQPSVTLTASPSGQTYQFSAGATPIGSSNQATVNSPGLYFVTVILGNGCSGVASVSVGQDTSVPTIGITATPSLTITQGQSTTLTASGANSYVWSTGSTANPIVVSTEGPYSVTGTTANGCTATASLTLTGSALPITITGLSASPNPVVAGQPITFTSTVANVVRGYYYTLTNGRGSTRTGTADASPLSQTLTAQNAGTQTYTLTVTSFDEPTASSATVDVTVSSGPAVADGPACTNFVNRPLLTANPVTGVYALGSTIYAATNGGLAISTDGGNSFPVVRTTASGLGANQVNAVYAQGSTVYAATNNGLSVSTDGAQSFTNYTTGLGNNQVRAVYVASNTIYVATPGGLAVSINDGQSFTNRTNTNGLGDNQVNGVYVVDNIVYAATNNGLSISTNGGSSFAVNRTTASPSGIASNVVLGVYAQGSTVYVDTDNGLSISTDGGQTFTNRTTDNGLGSNNVHAVYAVGRTVYAATNNGLSISTDGGQSFTNYTPANTANGLGSNVVYGVHVAGDRIYAATQGGVSFCPEPVVPPTITALIASPNPVQAGQPVLFTATVGEVTGSYAYTLANGIDTPLSGTASSVAFSQRLTANGSGLQSYSLTVTAENGTATATTSLSVLAPSSGLTITGLRTNRNQVPAGQSVEFTATLTGLIDSDIYSYTLTNGLEDRPLTGDFHGPDFIESVTAQGSGPQTYTLTVTSQKGNASATTSIVVIPENVTLIRFAILGVTPGGCETISGGERRVRFTPQYVGTNGEPISFSVVNELAPTTAPGPYSLRLYTDNPIITLVASQGGRGEVRFVYNWLAACQGAPTPPQAPVSAGIPSQTLRQGQTYQLVLTDYVTDPDGQTPQFTVQGLPAGLSLNESLISGTPSNTGTYPVSLTATDPGGLSIVVGFTLTVVSPSGTTPTFSIDGVSPVSCVLVDSVKQGYRVSFTPQYGGLTGQPISFSVVNELSPTTTAGPYTLRLYADNPVIMLKATQAGSPGEASFSYNWRAACGVEPPNPGSFGIIGATTVSCESVGSGQRKLTFSPQYAGRDGSPISFSVVNELMATPSPGPYSLNLYTDNPTITLSAQQGATVATYRYNWLAACPAQPGGRLGTGDDYASGLHVRVLGNPIGGNELVTEVTGAEGLPLQYELIDSRGRVLQRHQVDQAGRVERQHLPIGNQPAGLLLLRVSAPTQSQTIKLVKEN